MVETEPGRQVWFGPVGDIFRTPVPTGRFARPDEIASAVAYLISNAAALTRAPKKNGFRSLLVCKGNQVCDNVGVGWRLVRSIISGMRIAKPRGLHGPRVCTKNCLRAGYVHPAQGRYRAFRRVA
ncbi:hypothetical protein [Komagataeibacter diospyri]|uniref:hypothetical protein n=1 Tax=Komagataeibacter diospyri TaxID=1932662 RepID=UPI003757AD1A